MRALLIKMALLAALSGFALTACGPEPDMNNESSVNNSHEQQSAVDDFFKTLLTF